MKKTLFIVAIIFLSLGCADMNTASSVVEDYLSSYQNLEYQVIVDMEEVVTAEEDLTDEQKEVYRDILKKQYVDLTYEIISEKYEDDDASVTVSISVYDYYKAAKTASNYLKENASEFYIDNVYSLELYMDYKLNVYKTATEKIEYTITFDLIKEDGIWKLTDVSSDNLSKIHGIYDYEA